MIIELIVGIATVLAALSIGNVVLKKVWKDNEKNIPWFETIPLSTGLGLIVLAAYAFILNLVGLGYWHLLTLPLVAAIPLWIMRVKGVIEKLKALKKGIEASSFQFRAEFALISLLFIVGFLLALAPPSAARPGPIDWDSLNYHLVIPKTYLAQHSLASISFLAHDNWPHSLETFYTIPMSLAGSQAAKLAMLFVSVLMALALFSLARRFVKREQAIIAPLVFFSNFIVIFSLGTAYIDIALTFFLILSLLCLHTWLKQKSWQLLALAGAFAGFAASTKLIGLIPLALIGIITFYYSIKENKVTQMIPFAILSAIFILPWLLRTYVAYGNPIYPLFYSSLSWLGISSAGTEYFMSDWNAVALTSGTGRELIDFLLLPVILTFQGKLYNGIISPLYFAFAPLFLFSLRKISEFEKLLLLFAFVFTIPWFFLYQDARFFEPVLAIGAIFIAIAVAKFGSIEALAHRVVLVVVALALVISVLYGAKAFPVALGLQSEESYLIQTLDTYAPCKFVNNEETVRQVLFYKVVNAYYCDKPFAYTNLYNATHVSKEELVNQLERDGFTHIIIPRNLTSSEPVGIRQLIADSEPIYTSNGLAIYTIAS